MGLQRNAAEIRRTAAGLDPARGSRSRSAHAAHSAQGQVAEPSQTLPPAFTAVPTSVRTDPALFEYIALFP